MNNSLMVIFPYKTAGIWAFDDESVGLVREPFVDRVNFFIDTLAANIPDAGAESVYSFQPNHSPVGC